MIMHRRLIEILILVTFLGFNNLALADFQADFIACSKVSNGSERLDCYDAVAGYYKPSSNKSAAKPLTQIEEPSIEKVLAESKAVKNTTKPIVSDEERFGQSNKHGLELIQSEIVGSFTGWKKGLKLTLKNGQIWKVTNSRSGYTKMDNPKITITRGVFNSFDAKVEGLNARAKVKRIK